MKSEKAKEIINDGSCHVSDGILLDGHRVGCVDLVYYVDAIAAISAAEQEAEERMREKALSVFDDMWMWFDNGEDGKFEPDYEYHRRNFIKKMNE